MRKRKFRRLLFSSFVIFVILILFGLAMFLLWAANLKIPDSQSFNDRKLVQSTKIYDRTGQILLWDIHQNIQRTVVSFEDISRNLKNAVVAIEDDTFYQHHGFLPFSFLRAFFVDIITGKFTQGGSTITQQ